MKKRIGVVLCLILALGIGGCSRKLPFGLSARAPIIVTIWHYYNGAQMEEFDKLVDRFNDTVGKENGIIVEAFNRGGINDLIQAVEDNISGKVGANDLPDAFAAYADTAYQIEEEGFAVDIGKYMSKEELDEYEDAYIEEGIFHEDGGVTLFPIAKSTELFAINTTDWKKFAESTGATEDAFATWEGIAEVAQKYYNWTDAQTEEPDDGKAFFGRDAFANYMIIGSLQLGHEVFNVAGSEMTIDFDKETMRRIWDNYYVPYVNGYYGNFGKFRSDDVKTGKLLSFVGATSGVTYFPDNVTLEDGTTYPIESCIYPLPNFAGTEKYAVQQGAGMLILKSDETSEYATTLFLKWFTEIENNFSFAIRSGYLPVKKEARDISKLDQLLKESEIQIPDLMQSSLRYGMETVTGYQLYTSKAFPEGVQARNILNNSMPEKAEADRNSVLDAIEQGASRQEAIAPFLTDLNFEQWYEDTYNQLVKVGEQD